MLYAISMFLSDGDVILRILWMQVSLHLAHLREISCLLPGQEILVFTTGIYQLILLSCALYTQSKLVYCLLSATVIIEKLFALLSFFIYRQMSNPPRTYSLCSVSGKSKTQCSSSITFCFSSSDFSFSICRALLCMNYKSKTNEYHTDYKL